MKLTNMIPYGRQSINQDDIQAVVQALKGEFLTTGPLVEKFEFELERVVGAPCVVVSSGTAALHCAYAAIGIMPGDEIITTPLTFVATQATAVLLGAKIVFADIQSDTGNIDPKAVEVAITPRTKAIVAVDYAGHPADLDELRTIADRHGVYLIEDAAHSIGSTYKNRPIGSIADLTTFSFFPTKNLTTAEGGAISSIHPDLLLKARRFARQGLIRNQDEFKIKTEGAWHQEVHDFGLNYRLPDVLCALGISQIGRLDQFKRLRKTIFEKYNKNFSLISHLELPFQGDHAEAMWHLYPIRVSSNIREDFFNHLRASGIGVQVNYIPAYWHPAFNKEDYPRGLCPRAEEYYSSEVSLPIHPGLTTDEQMFVISSVKEFFQEFKF